jgi:hypothetical protein
MHVLRIFLAGPKILTTYARPLEYLKIRTMQIR